MTLAEIFCHKFVSTNSRQAFTVREGGGEREG